MHGAVKFIGALIVKMMLQNSINNLAKNISDPPKKINDPKKIMIL